MAKKYGPIDEPNNVLAYDDLGNITGIKSHTGKESSAAARYTTIGSRPTAVVFGVGICQIGSSLYVSDGIAWIELNVPKTANQLVISDYAQIVGAGGAGVETYLRVFQQDDGAGHAGGDVKLISNGWGQWSFNVDGNDLFLGASGYTTFKSYNLGVRLVSTANAVLFQVNDNGNTGFFGQTPTPKPIVTGSVASGAALISLLEALATLGLITNTTTA